jgi:hypothetical protein
VGSVVFDGCWHGAVWYIPGTANWATALLILTLHFYISKI